MRRSSSDTRRAAAKLGRVFKRGGSTTSTRHQVMPAPGYEELSEDEEQEELGRDEMDVLCGTG